MSARVTIPMRRLWALVLAAALAAGCGVTGRGQPPAVAPSSPTALAPAASLTPTPSVTPVASITPAPTATTAPSDTPPPTDTPLPTATAMPDPVLIAAGDIAS